jgi:hypothetical protein
MNTMTMTRRTITCSGIAEMIALDDFKAITMSTMTQIPGPWLLVVRLAFNHALK